MLSCYPKTSGWIGVFSNDFQVTVVDKANVLECSRLWREAEEDISSKIRENVIVVLMLSVFFGCVCVCFLGRFLKL